MMRQECAEQGIGEGLTMTRGIADGNRLRVPLRHRRGAMAPQGRAAALGRYPDNARVVVSEPLSDLPGAWIEVPVSPWRTMADGTIDPHDFAPDRFV